MQQNKIKKDVMVGFPCYDNKSEVGILQELFGAVNDPMCPVATIQYYNGDSLIPRARNKIAQMFLDSEFEYLMFVDSDIVFNRHMITRLRQHDKGIIGGVYLKKKLPYSPVMNHALADEGELSVMREIGTGFMMIRRDVLGAIAARWPEHHYAYDDDEVGGKEKQGYDWFRVGVRNGRYLSEDYFFCQLAGDLGIKTYLDKSIITQHIGRMAYPTSDNLIIETATDLLNRWRDGAPVPTDKVQALREAADSKLKPGGHGEVQSFPTPAVVEIPTDLETKKP